MGDYGDVHIRRDGPRPQNRTKVQQLKLMGQSHPTGLTQNLLKLFVPRPALEYRTPLEKCMCRPYIGLAEFVNEFAEPGDIEFSPSISKGETRAERRKRIHLVRLEKGAKKAASELEKYDPHSDLNAEGDPLKTLFVARLSYKTTELKIKNEFENYGRVKRVRIVTDKMNGKSRGYGFVEYQRTHAMKDAYKHADGCKIDNRRVLVDVERGRTIKNWRPRKFGGGLGSTRLGGNV